MGAAAAMMAGHLLDVVGFDVGSMQMCFLVPPGRSYQMSSVALLDPSNAAAPMPLSEVLQDILTMSVQPFPLRPPPALAGAGWTAAAAEAAAAAAAAMQLSGFSVQAMAESAAAFKVILGVGAAAKGAASPSGLRVVFEGVQPQAGGSSHCVSVALAAPAASARLRLPWPVQLEGHTARATRAGSRREVALTLPKAWLWPGDGDVLGKVEVESLPPLPLAVVGSLLGRMFSLREGRAKLQGPSGSSALGPPGSPAKLLFDVKETIQALFIVTLQRGKGPMAHSLHDASGGGTEAELTVQVHAVLGLPDGQPLLHVSYVDHHRALRMNPTPEKQLEAALRFRRMLSPPGPNIRSGGVINTVKCAKGETAVLRRLLERNAQRLVPPRWQQALLQPPTEWVASFLLPLYSDSCLEFDGEAAALMAEVERAAPQPQVPRQQPPSRAAPTRNAGAAGVPPPSGPPAQWSVRQLKAFLDGKGVDHRHCPEKPHLVQLCQAAMAPQSTGGGGESAVAGAPPEAAAAARCSGCGRESEHLKKCSCCQRVAYCNVDCQARHWPEHKKECRRLAARS